MYTKYVSQYCIKMFFIKNNEYNHEVYIYFVKKVIHEISMKTKAVNMRVHAFESQTFFSIFFTDKRILSLTQRITVIWRRV